MPLGFPGAAGKGIGGHAILRKAGFGRKEPSSSIPPIATINPGFMESFVARSVVTLRPSKRFVQCRAFFSFSLPPIWGAAD